jgi:hypothetical protein
MYLVSSKKYGIMGFSTTNEHMLALIKSVKRNVSEYDFVAFLMHLQPVQ